ncbi:hypothetical protein [Cetobacterium sp. ZWU0022]|uniref:hypothetical protein n=1 Tax=Cetobacterium sp. ZWU0022 TaxID=1340502 RepID=UPI0006483E63|nr:hypothetical protein [Cetobacterium sp. ZWU0022]
MNQKLENLLNYNKEELSVKLKEVYNDQKLSPTARAIARWIEIVVIGIISFSCFIDGEVMYGVLWSVGGVYTFYRLVNSKIEDKETLDDLDKITEGIENFKKYKKGELGIEISEELVKKTEKGIGKNLPYLLKVSGLSRMLAFVPVLNIFQDETHMYTHREGALVRLWEGTLTTQGLKYYSNENIKTLQNEEGITI